MIDREFTGLDHLNVEFVFNIPGMGLYMLNSIFLKDYNAIMALTLFSAVFAHR